MLTQNRGPLAGAVVGQFPGDVYEFVSSELYLGKRSGWRRIGEGGELIELQRERVAPALGWSAYS
jgi:hypothetical protein